MLKRVEWALRVEGGWEAKVERVGRMVVGISGTEARERVAGQLGNGGVPSSAALRGVPVQVGGVRFRA